MSSKKKINYVIPDKIAKKINDKRTKEYRDYKEFLSDEANFNKVYTTIDYFSYNQGNYGNKTDYKYSNYFIKKYLGKYYSHIKLNYNNVDCIINIKQTYIKNMNIGGIILTKLNMENFFKNSDRFFISPVKIIWYKSTIYHANILLIDKKKKSIVLIEPYGKLKSVKSQNQIIREIKKLFTSSPGYPAL